MSSGALDRRALMRGVALAGGTFALARWFPAWAQPVSVGIAPDMQTLTGESIALRIAHQPITVDGRAGHGIAMNGTIPAPLIRLREGQMCVSPSPTRSTRTARSTGMACWSRPRWTACRA